MSKAWKIYPKGGMLCLRHHGSGKEFTAFTSIAQAMDWLLYGLKALAENK